MADVDMRTIYDQVQRSILGNIKSCICEVECMIQRCVNMSWYIAEVEGLIQRGVKRQIVMVMKRSIDVGRDIVKGSIEAVKSTIDISWNIVADVVSDIDGVV